MNERAIADAIAMQARAVADIWRGYGTEEQERQAVVMDMILEEAENCGHQWGTVCDCILCTYIGGSFDQAIAQVMGGQQGAQ